MGLEALLKERTAVSEKLSKLLDTCAAEKRGLSEDEAKEHIALEAKFDELTTTIEALKKQEARKKQLSEDAEVRLPNIQTVREEHCDEQGNYRGYPAFNKAGLGHTLCDIVKFRRDGVMPERLDKLQKFAAGASGERAEDGGLFIQSDHISELFGLTLAEAIIAPMCRRVTTLNREVTYNSVDETSRATGSRYGGVQVYRRKEAGAVQASKPKFKPQKVAVEGLMGLYYATDELLDDAPALQTLITPMYTSEMAWRLDYELLFGTGAGECLGILNSPGTIVVSKENAQANNTVVFENVENMVDRLLPSADSGAWFLHHSNLTRQFRRMYITPGENTDFLAYVPANKGIGGTNFPELLDKPARRIEQAKDLGDKGDIILGNWKYYLLLERQGIELAQSAHVQFLTAEMAFRFTQRVGGQPMMSVPIQDAHGNTTRSPFVVLAERQA